MTVREFLKYIEDNKIGLDYVIWLNQTQELKEYNLSVDKKHETLDIDE